jgi:hypothetical protein
MKNTLAASVLVAPLLAYAQCPSADIERFFASHPPGAGCPASSSKDKICIDMPRLVDDTLYHLVLSASPDFRRQPGAAAVKSWVGGVPPNTFPVVRQAQRMDLTWRSAYVTCDGRHVYLQDSGGLNDRIEWYGPIPISALDALRQ